jgi:hypothetical protein
LLLRQYVDMSEAFSLVVPALPHLPGYRAALESGWSPDNVNGAVTARRELDWIAKDPAAFLASLDDREALGAPIAMPGHDASTASWLSALAVGRRLLRQHRLPLAAWHG